MPTILDLYKSATKNVVENEIYGKDASRIESKGIINIPRQAALLLSSPNSVADLIGGQAAGLLKGTANRPSDTIFKDNKVFSKPISIRGGLAISDGKLKDTVEADNLYFVKQSPSPASLFSKIKQGASTPLGLASATAASALTNPIATSKNIKNLAKGLKRIDQKEDEYGAALSLDKYGNLIPIPKNNDGKNDNGKNDNGIKFSKYAPIYSIDSSTKEYKRTGIYNRGTGNKTWDLINNDILKYEKINDEAKQKFESNHSNNKITYVTITTYGDRTNKIILPGTITGLTEDYSPEWSNFKYVGSPFYSYRYGGVEASIKFNVKMYYTDKDSLATMKANLTKLKKLVFPYEELSVITYGKDTNKQTQAVSFSPNLVYFSISGLYHNLFAYVEELSFSIDDNVSWATVDEDMSGNKTEPYPTAIDVSLGFKIIPNVKISTGETKTLSYNFSSGSMDMLIVGDAVKPT